MTVRSGFTLIELCVASLVAMLALVIAYQGIVGLVRNQKSSDLRSSRALLEAQLMEVLLQDLRSTVLTPDERARIASLGTPAGEAGAKAPTTLTRYVWREGSLQSEDVTWKQEEPDRIVRMVGGKRTHTYDFRNLLGPDLKAIEFKIDVIPEREWGL